MNKENNYNVLAIDDAKDTLMLLEFDLVDEGYNVITAESAEQALKLLNENTINLILLNMYMPGISGLEMLHQLKSTPDHKHIPIIMLSSSDDENQIVSALDFGADDYVTKPYISKVLLARMKTSLRLFEKTKALESLAKTDFLTNLSNKGAFEASCLSIISQANREAKNIIVAMLDIDYFKKVNDTHGHEAGDKVLVEFATLMSECFRGYDALGRIGGEEFAICMTNINFKDAYCVFERFRKTIENQIIYVKNDAKQAIPLSITVSIGVAKAQGQNIVYEDLLREADKYLYEAKNNGRNCIVTNKNNLSVKSVLSDIEEPLKKNTNHEDIEQSEEELLSIQNIENDDSPFPGIDYDIGVGNVLGDDELFKEILLMFYEDHANDEKNIQKAISSEDQDDCKRLVHTLKGVSCSIGAMALFEQVKLLDIAINEAKVDEYQSLFDSLKPEFIKVISGIEKGLADKINSN